MDLEGELEIAKEVFRKEINTLEHIQNNLDYTFIQIEEAVASCKGKVILCGIGKSGHIARKISATLASLGTSSFFLHPAEALHGDLGMVSEEDTIILISNSGETKEIIHLMPSLKVIGAKLICITGKKESTLAKECELVQILEVNREACHLNLAPTSSTTASLVYGDALAIVISEDIGFSASDFGLYHPAGTLGKKVLIKAKDVMAQGSDLPVVKSGCKITDAIVEMSKKGLGVIAIINNEDKLCGILTDGDLRRAIEKKADLYGDIIDSVMTQNPQSIYEEILLVDVLQKLKESRLNNYPVINREKNVIGMITWQMIIREGIIL